MADRVEESDLPSLQFGHLLGERRVLDVPRHFEFLLDALALAYLLLQALFPQCRAGRSYAPLFGDFALRYAMDDDGLVGQLPASRSHAHKLCPMVGRVHDEAAHHLVSPGYLILDDQAAWREGGVIIRRISRRLLPDTLARALDASRRVASFAIITDAKDEDARSFYQHYGFQLLPTESHDRHLFLPMGTVERLFAG